MQIKVDVGPKSFSGTSYDHRDRNDSGSPRSTRCWFAAIDTILVRPDIGSPRSNCVTWGQPRLSVFAVARSLVYPDPAPDRIGKPAVIGFFPLSAGLAKAITTSRFFA